MTNDSGSTVLEALDAKVYLSAEGVTFERSKLRASGRGVGPVAFAPWSAVRGATSTEKELRVDVAGYDSPRLVTGDPWGAALKRGRGEEAAALVQAIATRAAGEHAQAVLAESSVEPPVVEAVPAPQAPPLVFAQAQPGSVDERLVRGALRMANVSLFLAFLPVVVFVVVAIFVALILFT